MSVTLDYDTTGPVPEPIAAEVVAASHVLLERDWWAEPLIVRQSAHTRRLRGSTKVILGGYGFVEVPDDEEAVMFCRDAGFIVKTLTQWSQEYKVSWFLSIAGAPLGEIVDGTQSPGVSSFAYRICANLKLPLTSAPSILKKHEARKNRDIAV